MVLSNPKRTKTNLHLFTLLLFCICGLLIGCSDLNINVRLKNELTEPPTPHAVDSSVQTVQPSARQSTQGPSSTSSPSSTREPALAHPPTLAHPLARQLEPFQDAQSISTGANHACAVTTQGDVKCWGSNRFGQLGAGPVPDSSTPLNVISLTERTKSVTAGVAHSCAVVTNGGVKCWGSNSHGQLGSTVVGIRSGPIDTEGITTEIGSLALGERSTCGLASDGSVHCWGGNPAGQLGDGTTADRLTPVKVVDLPTDVAAIAAGAAHVCAMTEQGGVHCWGSNSEGQLGDSTNVTSTVPVDVFGLSKDVVAIAAGSGRNGRSTCALLASGQVTCWGNNDSGQLGNGTRVDSSRPVAVAGLMEHAAAIAVGSSHACALLESSLVQCWGSNQHGQLGHSLPQDSMSPVTVQGLLEGIMSISAGEDYTCVLTQGERVQCWGSNRLGELGDGTIRASALPRPVVGLSAPATKLIAGQSFSCALTNEGRVECWGSNEFGTLGNGSDVAFAHTPVLVERLPTDVIAIAGKYEHACALTADGAVWCWGNNFRKQLGILPDISNVPVPISGLQGKVVAISAGHKASCALTSAGGLECWGRHLGLEPGNPDSTRSIAPIELEGLTNDIRSISVGHHHSCILTADNGAKCWGKGADNELGGGSVTSGNDYGRIPVPVYGIDNGAAVIDTGFHGSCVLMRKGNVRCWGNNWEGQIGNGTFGRGQAWSTPVDVVGMADTVTSLAMGHNHVCVLTSKQRAKCWGRNRGSALGDGTNGNRFLPVDVRGLDTDVTSITAGHDHTCAILHDGSVWCWGANTTGQLGVESVYQSPSPLDVMVLKFD